MLSFLVSIFNKRSSPHYQTLINTAEPNMVYRDNLNKTHKRKDKKIGQDKEVMRVKVVMTKEEANRLLSKCKEGGVIGFKDAATELVQIPVNRVRVVSTSKTTLRVKEACQLSLGTIEEEY